MFVFCPNIEIYTILKVQEGLVCSFDNFDLQSAFEEVSICPLTFGLKERHLSAESQV